VSNDEPKFDCIIGLAAALETPAARTDAGIAEPATFRALIWKFSIIFKA